MTTKRIQLEKQFGQASEIPASLKCHLEGLNAYALKNDDNFTIFLPHVFSNANLTEIYDKVFSVFPTARAHKISGGSDRYIQIPSNDIDGLS